MELEINKEFYELIPALEKREADALITSLSSEGCRQPITIWKGKNIIVDGHNRYAICTKLNIPFKVEELEFEDEDRVKIWMINNQLARRNLSIELRAELACTLAVVEHELAEKRKLANLKQNANKLETAEISQSTEGSKTDPSVEKKGKSLKKAAEKAGISYNTAKKYKSIKTKGTDEQKEALRSGQKKISTVYKEIQAKEKPKENVQSNECDIEKLLKGKTIKTPYLLLYSKQEVETGEEMRTYLSNCKPYANLLTCRDYIMNLVHGKCDEDDFMQLRLALKRVIGELVLTEEDKNNAVDYLNNYMKENNINPA
jgi:ParB-like chromosome segregation protein Spo0J